jgi:hypothetical protein
MKISQLKADHKNNNLFANFVSYRSFFPKPSFLKVDNLGEPLRSWLRHSLASGYPLHHLPSRFAPVQVVSLLSLSLARLRARPRFARCTT